MTPDKYLLARVEDQINWYNMKSQCNQNLYKIFRVTEIIFASTIPFLVSHITNDTPILKIAVGCMGWSVAIISGVVALYKLQENWIEYRATTENLKHEKFLYITKTSPYDSEDSFHRLVERVEALISKENSTWIHNSIADRKEKKHD